MMNFSKSMPGPHFWSPDNLLQVFSQSGSDLRCSYTSPFQATSVFKKHIIQGAADFKDPSAVCENNGSENVSGEKISPHLSLRRGKSCGRKEVCPVPIFPSQLVAPGSRIRNTEVGSPVQPGKDGNRGCGGKEIITSLSQCLQGGLLVTWKP